MNREQGPEVLSLPAEQIELALARIEHSRAFRSSARHRALLRHIVTRAVEGEIATLKETLIAVEVFGRKASQFDPKSDTIVRVEARRLRARLSNYYRSDGHDAPLRIELPVGTYIPLIAQRLAADVEPSATRRARDLTERGEHYLRQALSRETLEAAAERFDAALRESPDHAPAYVGLGRAWLNIASGWYQEPAIASDHAAEALRRALELEPDNPVAHTLLAALEHQFERNWLAARRRFEHAVSLAPEQAFVHSAYGCHLYIRGALEESERELTLARKLDPHYVNARKHMVNLRIAQRRFDDAEAELDAMSDITADTMALLGSRGALALYRGDVDAAIQHYVKASELMPDYPGTRISLAGALASAGRHAEADRIMGETMARYDAKLVSPYVIAIFHTRRGQFDEALTLLERSYREHDPLAMQIPREPSFDALHGQARWKALCAAIAAPPRANAEAA